MHKHFWPLTFLAILLPIGGVVAGLVYISKDDKEDNNLGYSIIGISIVAFVVWYGLYSGASNV